jgi:TRAP-type C4-dicarboxylate transport system substrate-binding protein
LYHNNKIIMSNTILFNKTTFLSLKNEYQNAVETSKNTFMFEGNQLLTNYAKYLIEYLTPTFK